ncbi:hypothetical protein ACS8FD_06830 [Psychrobacter sp. 1U2]|uniref:hypothetical protein n=1 Tax=Psychrobacter sp. 1U2 TaxID=3453577 RepID=UPI003F48233E
MSNHTDIVEELYGSRYKGNLLWENVVKKLTVRQAYVFYYSLTYHGKNEVATALGIFDLPDKTEVHRSLMDALQKENKPSEVARIIADNAHKILINDNDLLWVKNELRAALWLSYFITKTENGDYRLLLDLLRSTSATEFTERLIKVIDIHGCSRKGDRSLMIRGKFDRNVQYLELTHSVTINNYRGDYVSNRIDDYKLNWLDKLPEDEIDLILERFIEEKVLSLYGTFVPIIRKDKVELIKASLDIQGFIYRYHKNNELSQPYSTYSSGFTTDSPEVENENIKSNSKKKKRLAVLSSEEIIDLLKKAYSSREYRKKGKNSKCSNTFKLNKESNAILLVLSDKLNATPKKAVEALIKSANLKDRHELLKISKHISGRRSTKKELTKPEDTIEAAALEETDKFDKSKELEGKIISEDDSLNPLQRMQQMLKKNNNNQMNWETKSSQLTSDKHKYNKHLSQTRKLNK